jgi:microsomal dipeptidase-like Zn-dependent dipeptidase
VAITDLHAHYPMRVVSDVTPDTAISVMRKALRRPTFGDKLRALILGLASRLFSDRDPFSGYRVTPQTLREGGVSVALSVLYRPSEELDPHARFASPPKPSYFALLLEDLEAVEAEVGTHDPSQLRIARDRSELDRCVEDGATALVHCVEGGFHLGADPDGIDAHVAELARRGVAYITVAHLFFRGVAAVAPALPFLSDRLYGRLFGAREGEGLTDVGRAAVRAMAHHRVLVDLSHMRSDSVAETMALLDEADPERSLPVVSTHAGFRFGKQVYMHDEATVEAIAARDGVIGLITAEHQLLDGLDTQAPEDFDGSFEVIRRHIDRIA